MSKLSVDDNSAVYSKFGPCRSLADVLGEPRAAGLGRLRRHLMAASLCQLLVADASAALREPQRAARALALCLRVLDERSAFEVGHCHIPQLFQVSNKPPGRQLDRHPPLDAIKIRTVGDPG